MNEEITTQAQELTDPETQTQTQETTSSEVTTTTSLNSEIDYSEGFPVNPDNDIHRLFSVIGVDLDYVPQNNYQCFTMALQFLAALWFIWWFVKYLFTFIRGVLK
jgi:hypothetical protein